MIDLNKALEELRTKSHQEIEIEAGWNWASRAAAAYTLVTEQTEISKKFFYFIIATDFNHEAVEHSALPEDMGVLTKEIQKQLQPYLNKALESLKQGIQKDFKRN